MTRSGNAAPDVVVIGGGIIGISAAAHLADAGCRVTVLDRTGICEETSSGNAAGLAFSEILPLAQKGLLRQVPGWLLDPLGPLSIPPADLPRLLPWLVRFWRASWRDRHDASVAAQAALMDLAERAWQALLEQTGTGAMVRDDGALELCESEAELDALRPGWALRARHGIAFRHVRGDELAELQPGLSDRFVAGTFIPGWRTVADPKLLGKALWAHAERLGAHFEHGRVASVRIGTRGPEATLEDGRTFAAGSLVVAAGAWSHLLSAQLGDPVPLEAERGYNTTLPPGAFDLRRQLIFARHGFVVAPLSTGIRVGGAVELGGLERPPNHARSRAMLEKARLFLPGLKTESGREWMGHRPSLPDTLPVIGRSTASPNVVYAFGHGHLGLTQSAATGQLVRDLVLHRPTAIDLAPFSPKRF